MASSSLPDRLVLSVREVALVLGIGRNQAYAAVHRGEIPAIRLGRRLLVPREAVEHLASAVGKREGPEHGRR